MSYVSGSSARRGRRRVLFAGVAVGLVAALAPVGSPPAGATTAALVTPDGLGIRVDERALTGPALTAIENALQPFVDQMIYDGATAPGAPFSSNIGVTVSSDLELSFDFIDDALVASDGRLEVHADIRDIEIEFRMDPVWPFADCSIWARPDDGTVDVSADLNRGVLPDNPLVVNPVVASWDDEPTVDSSGVCWTYVVWQAFTNWWDGLWDSGDEESTAARIERELNDIAQDLVDDVWDAQVVPVLASLGAFGIDIAELYTDDHGLVVTADVDATGGIEVPGLTTAPVDVSAAPESGATADMLDVLEQRAVWSHVIVSIHPNVVNQFLQVLNQLAPDMIAGPLDGLDIEQALFGTDDPTYNNGSWSWNASLLEPMYITPDPITGAPILNMPDVRFRFYNPNARTLILTTLGEIKGTGLKTEIRDLQGNWGPSFDTTGTTIDLTTITPRAGVTLKIGFGNSDMNPYAVDSVDHYGSAFIPQFLTVPPIEIAGLNVNLCTTCPRYTGDQNYTETFQI